MAGWRFVPYDGYDDINASTAAESFLERSIRDLATGVVREGIQNSLDARRPELPADQPVRVRMTFAGFDDARFWTGDLLPHLKLPDVGAPDGDECDGPGDCLIFEDFGTTGLTGDYMARYVPGTRNNFVNFLYHEGVTGKREKQRGSRGVGKIVFVMASRARTFFACTIRADDLETPVLVGKNVLKFRSLDGKSWKGPGYFIEAWPVGGPRAPVTDPAVLARFCSDFKLTREAGEPGLSIVMPFVDASVTADAVRKAVIAEYHYAILARSLEVIIDDHGSVETFSADNLPASGDAAIDRDVDLARWALSHAHPGELSTEAPAPDQVQRLEPALIPDGVREAVRTAMDGGTRVAVRVPIHVHPRNEEPQQSHFDVFLEHSDDYANKPAFIRELLPVSNVHNAKKASHVRALVLINEGPLADLLRAAEGANHTDWNARTDRFKEHYRGRFGEIPCVAASAADLMSIIRGENERPTGGIAIQFFSVAPQDKPRKQGKDQGGKGGEPDTKGHPDTSPAPKSYCVERTAGGFLLRRANPGKTPCPQSITVRAAYDVIRGSAWGQWDPADFDFSTDPPCVEFDAHHATVDCSNGKGNQFVIRPEADLFHVRVTGFDRNRDLIIDHRAEKADQ